MKSVEDLGVQIQRRLVDLGPPSADLAVVDLPQLANGVPLLLGVAQDGARLLVALPPNLHRTLRADRRSAGIQLVPRPVEQAGVLRHYLDIVCPKRELDWVFCSLAADILLRIETTPDAEPTVVARRCVASWRAMFARGARLLTLHQLAGLFGELCVLEAVLDRAPAAVGTWTGPLRKPHDFEATAVDVEVKTTLSTDDRVVHVHGIEQLTRREGGELALAHLRVEHGAEDGETIPEIADRLTEIAQGSRLTALLRAAGYHPEHRDSYATTTFKTIEEQWFIVDDDFPRLTGGSFPEGQIPAGLSDFRYRLDLDAVMAPPIADSRRRELLDLLVQ